MLTNPTIRARSLAISVLLCIVFIPSLVNAAPNSPTDQPQAGETPPHTPAVCPAQTEPDTTISGVVGTRDKPVPLGDIITVKNASSAYKIGISEVVRGADAWKRIQKYNAQNTPPAEGKEYIMVFV